MTIDIASAATSRDSYLPLEYGDLELPELTETDERIRALDLNFEDLLKFKGDESLDRLKELQGSYALRLVDEIVYDYVKDEIKKLGLPKEKHDAFCNAVEKRDWSGIPPNTGAHFAARELIVKANRLKFQLIEYWLENTENSGLTKVGEAEYMIIMPAMAATDLMYLKMATEKRPIDSNERRKRGLNNECAVVREIGGGIIEVPFHEAYPEETGEIVTSYRILLEQLEIIAEENPNDAGLQELIGRKKAYYEALLKATKGSRVEDWRKVDALLPKQVRDGNDIIHIHSIEVGYMEDRALRSPESSLRVPDQNEKKAQDLTTETKRTMLKSMDSGHLADLPAVQKSRGLVQSSNATVRHFLGSGMDIDLKPAGQILPNEFEARAEGGIDSSLDVQSTRERLPVAIERFKTVFGEAAFKELCEPRIDIDEIVGSDIASHELGHAVGIVDDATKRLGDTALMIPYIEEWKATTAGFVLNELIPHYEGEMKNIERLRTWLTSHIMTACRYAGARAHPYAVAYFRKSMMLMTTAQETGVLELDTEDKEFPWKINLDEERVRMFSDRLFAQFREVMELYDHGTEDDLNTYLEKNLRSTAFLEFLCERISNPDIAAFTPGSVAKLPKDLLTETTEVENDQASTREDLGEVLNPK